MNALLELNYRNFKVVLLSQDNHSRKWIAPVSEYKTNLFATYLYTGRIHEYRYDNNIQGDLVSDLYGELFLNWDVTLDYPTIEHFDKAVWLCFSSYMPLTAKFLEIDGDSIIPPNTGVYNVLGTCTETVENLNVRALQYIVPRNRELHLAGAAKVILISRGNFVNKPIDLDY
jgi:hypothetical protein